MLIAVKSNGTHNDALTGDDIMWVGKKIQLNDFMDIPNLYGHNAIVQYTRGVTMKYNRIINSKTYQNNNNSNSNKSNTNKPSQSKQKKPKQPPNQKHTHSNQRFKPRIRIRMKRRVKDHKEKEVKANKIKIRKTKISRNKSKQKSNQMRQMFRMYYIDKIIFVDQAQMQMVIIHHQNQISKIKY